MDAEHSEERKIDGPVSQPRPLTLLIFCGVVLAAAVLVVTGLVAGYLRQQTLAASEAGLSRLDSVLVAAGNRSLLRVETVLSDITSHIRLADVPQPDAAARDIRAAAAALRLDREVRAAHLAGVGLADADGTIVVHTGGWPAGDDNIAKRDYFLTLRENSGLESTIGAPVELEQGGLRIIPVAHKLRSTNGGFAGVAVTTVPVSDFENLYRAVPLGEDGVISLMRRDGAVLAEYPRVPDDESRVASAAVKALLAEGAQGVFEEDPGERGDWRIDAVQPLSDYPVAVVVSSSGAHALIGWSRQATMFGAFAVCGVLTIGLMVMLIGRQIRTHNALAAIRAEKIEIEHARLVAEAELLKKERLSVLGQFTATVANELRNPLSAIRNTLFTMREIATTSGLVLDRPIARIQRSISRCDRIIGDLLEYIRSPELSRVAVNFDEWLRDVLIEHALPPAVTLVEEYGAGGALELTVADTGTGIAPETMSRIFEPLFSTKSFGAGLGLSTVKQIIVQHGGTIGIDSELGVGTSVRVRLPLEQILKVAA